MAGTNANTGRDPIDVLAESVERLALVQFEQASLGQEMTTLLHRVADLVEAQSHVIRTIAAEYPLSGSSAVQEALKVQTKAQRKMAQVLLSNMVAMSQRPLPGQEQTET